MKRLFAFVLLLGITASTWAGITPGVVDLTARAAAQAAQTSANNALFPTSAVWLSNMGVAAAGHGTTNIYVVRFTNVKVNTGTDLTYADSATLGGAVTVNTTGVYQVSFSNSYVGLSEMGVTVNDSAVSTRLSSNNAASIVCVDFQFAANAAASCSATVPLTAGDVLRPKDGGGTVGSGTGYAQFSVTRLR